MTSTLKRTSGRGAARSARTEADGEIRGSGNKNNGRGQGSDGVTPDVRYTISSDGACASVALPKQARGAEYVLAGYPGGEGYYGADGSAVVALSKTGEAQELRAYGRKATPKRERVRVTYVYVTGGESARSGDGTRQVRASEREGTLVEIGKDTVTLIDADEMRWVVRNYTEIKYLDRVDGDAKDGGDLTAEDTTRATVYAVQFPEALEAGVRLSWPVSRLTWLPLITFATVPTSETGVGSRTLVSAPSSLRWSAARKMDDNERLLLATITLQAVVTNEGPSRTGTFELTTEPTRRAATVRHGGIPVEARAQRERKMSRAPMSAMGSGATGSSTRDAESRATQQEKLTYAPLVAVLGGASQHKLHIQTFNATAYTKHYTTHVGANDGDTDEEGDTTDGESGGRQSGSVAEVRAHVRFRVAAPVPTSRIVFLDSLGKEFAASTTVTYTPARQTVTASLGASKTVSARHSVWMDPIRDSNSIETTATSGSRSAPVGARIARTRVIRIASTIENTDTNRSSTLKVRYTLPYGWSTDAKNWKIEVSEPPGNRTSLSSKKEPLGKDGGDADASEESGDESAGSARSKITSTHSHVYVRHNTVPSVVPFRASSATGGYAIILGPRQRLLVTWIMSATESQ